MSKEDLIMAAQQRENSKVYSGSLSKGDKLKDGKLGNHESLQLHIIGGSNPGLLFIVRLLIRPIVNPLPVDVGPNQVLINPKPLLIQSPRLVTTLSLVTE